MVDDPDAIVERLSAADVGDLVRLRIEKDLIAAQARDRVSPVFEAPAEAAGRPVFRGFTKDAAGMWDLESLTGAKASVIVEVVVRRAASDL